jgi:hypothetical protein
MANGRQSKHASHDNYLSVDLSRFVPIGRELPYQTVFWVFAGFLIAMSVDCEGAVLDPATQSRTALAWE